MKPIIAVALLWCLSGVAVAQTAPSNPIEIQTEIGKIGEGNAEKVTVSCLVRISRQGIAYYIRVAGQEPARGQDTLDVTEEIQPEMISTIEKIRRQDKDMQEKITGYSISAATSVSSGVRTLTIERDYQISPKLQIRLDPDGTDSLIAMMKKGQAIQAWMKTRAPALKL